MNERTTADGVALFAGDYIEAQLAHKPRGVRGFYNHASYMSGRVPMMQAYADLVMPASPVGDNVIALRRAA